MHRTGLLIVEDLLFPLLDDEDETGTTAGEGAMLHPLGGAVLDEFVFAGQIETEAYAGNAIATTSALHLGS